MKTGEAIMALKMMNLTGAHPFLHWEEMMEVRDMAISALREQEERRWIPVTERMPQEHQIVVGWTKDNPFSCYREEVVTWNGKGWVFVYAQRYVTNVKYWMPLPEPYKGEHDD